VTREPLQCLPARSSFAAHHCLGPVSTYSTLASAAWCRASRPRPTATPPDHQARITNLPPLLSTYASTLPFSQVATPGNVDSAFELQPLGGVLSRSWCADPYRAVVVHLHRLPARRRASATTAPEPSHQSPAPLPDLLVRLSFALSQNLSPWISPPWLGR